MIVELYDKNKFIFGRNFQTVLHSDHNNSAFPEAMYLSSCCLHPHQHLVLLVFQIFQVLQVCSGMSWLLLLAFPLRHLMQGILLCCVFQSYLTLHGPMDCSPPGSSVHRDSPGRNTGVGCLAFFQRIFPIQGSNLGLPHLGGFFTI